MEAIFSFEFYPLWKTKPDKKENNNRFELLLILYYILSLYTLIFSTFTNFRISESLCYNLKRKGKNSKERNHSDLYRYSIYRPLATNNSPSSSSTNFPLRYAEFPTTPCLRKHENVRLNPNPMRIPIFLRVGHATVRCLRGDLELRIFVINKAVHYRVSRINYSKSIFFYRIKRRKKLPISYSYK